MSVTSITPILNRGIRTVRKTGGLSWARKVYFGEAEDLEPEWQAIVEEYKGDIDYLIDRFDNWVKTPTWILVKNIDTKEYKQFLAKKRGDENYAKMVKAKFGQLVDLFKGMNDELVRFEGKRRFTRVAWVTLGIKEQRDDNWGYTSNEWSEKKQKYVPRRRGLPDYWNRFITRLRQYYGKVSFVRIWESHKSGLPHVHGVLIFWQRWFEYIKNPRFNKRREPGKGNKEWIFKGIRFFYYDKSRGKNKPKNDCYLANNYYLAPIEDGWMRNHPFKRFWNPTSGSDDPREWDFSDWTPVYGVAGCLLYLMKYMKKWLDRENDISDLNLAKLWVYKKRSFAISKDLQELLTTRLYIDNSKGLDKQETLDGGHLEEKKKYWHLIGVFKSEFDWLKVKIIGHRDNYDGTFDLEYCRLDDG
jgi:hypothetical protein